MGFFLLACSVDFSRIKCNFLVADVLPDFCKIYPRISYFLMNFDTWTALTCESVEMIHDSHLNQNAFLLWRDEFSLCV